MVIGGGPPFWKCRHVADEGRYFFVSQTGKSGESSVPVSVEVFGSRMEVR